MLHDITELRRVDQIRRDFVANVSHELRTPLTAIRGYVEALADDDVSQEESRQFLDIIMRHALRMERLVKDLLRLARLDAGQETLELVRCDTRALVQSVVTDLTAAIKERGQRVDIVIGAGSETIVGDQSKLHDALRNLIANASTYAPEHTVVAVETARTDDRVAIAISDQGPGIPEEDRRVFSSVSTGSTSRARAIPVAPAWDSRSSSTWSSCTAARSGPRTGPKAARGSSSSSGRRDRTEAFRSLPPACYTAAACATCWH